MQGEISFPGGRVQEEDLDHEMTALREAEEEVGLNRDEVDVVGHIGVHHGGRGFRVSPYVGLIGRDAQIEACPREVAEIFEVPLKFLLDRNNHRTEKMSESGMDFKMFSIRYGDYHIWGLTAGILLSLVERLEAA